MVAIRLKRKYLTRRSGGHPVPGATPPGRAKRKQNDPKNPSPIGARGIKHKLTKSERELWNRPKQGGHVSWPTSRATRPYDTGVRSVP